MCWKQQPNLARPKEVAAFDTCLDWDINSRFNLLPTATFAQRVEEKKNTQHCPFPRLYVLVNITSINRDQPKGSSYVLIQTEVVKPVHDLRARALWQLSLEKRRLLKFMCSRAKQPRCRKTLSVKTCMQGQKSDKRSRRQGTYPVWEQSGATSFLFYKYIKYGMWRGGKKHEKTLKLYKPPCCPIKGPHTAQGTLGNTCCLLIHKDPRGQSIVHMKLAVTGCSCALTRYYSICLPR